MQMGNSTCNVYGHQIKPGFAVDRGFKYEKNNRKYTTKEKAKVVVCSLLATTTFAGCMNTSDEVTELNSAPTQTIEQTQTCEESIEETTINETAEVNETTQETNIVDNFTVETVQYSSGIDYSIDRSFELNSLCYAPGRYDFSPLYGLGYDNYQLRNNISNYYFSETGIQDDTLTAANLHSFQFGIQHCAQFEYALNDELSFNHNYIPRVILSRLELKFLIDEIPAWFFEEYFPEYTELFSNPPDEIEQYLYDFYYNYIGIETDVMTIEEFQALSPEAQKFLIFSELYCYNLTRSGLIYNYWHGEELNYVDDILQVRDEETGRFVLVPTEEQYYQLMGDLHQIQTFENIDLIHPETEEQLSEIFGINTEEVIPYDMFGYESQTFSYVDGQVVRTR